MPQSQPPQVIRAELGTPDAIVVQTSSGHVLVVADPGVTDVQLDAITLAAEHLPRQPMTEPPTGPIPVQRWAG